MLMHTKLMKQIISLEYMIAALLIAAFYVVVAHFDWWWLIILFLAFDISAVGYFVNDRVGAFVYNLGHSIVGPAILAALYIATDNRALLFVTLLWLFHIFADRAFGFGLKHVKGFHHTHLGPIGKAKVKTKR
jgi:hypothetical protein